VNHTECQNSIALFEEWVAEEMPNHGLSSNQDRKKVILCFNELTPREPGKPVLLKFDNVILACSIVAVLKRVDAQVS
jgi:hypothetical protein